MAVGEGVLVLVLRAEAITLLGKPLSIFRNIDKVPAEAFVALLTHLVGPVCNGRKAVIANQKQKSNDFFHETSGKAIEVSPPGRAGSIAATKFPDDCSHLPPGTQSRSSA